MNEDCRYHHSHGAQCIRQNVEKDPMHILVAVRMGVSVMIVAMTVPMAMLERHNTNEIDPKTSNADKQQLPDTVHLAAG